MLWLTARQTSSGSPNERMSKVVAKGLHRPIDHVAVAELEKCDGGIGAACGERRRNVAVAGARRRATLLY